MADVTDDEVALTWINERKSYEDGSKTIGRGGFKQLDRICEKDPRRALRVIEMICNKDSTNTIMEALAAGPLENLLVMHGSDVIDQVEHLAKMNPVFKELLGGVWRRDMEEAVWERVVAARSGAW
jgi:hypothetical protein